jgi:hypothetical protein
MKPHLDEAWQMLRLAERDIKAFEVLKKAPDVHLSITYFHVALASDDDLTSVVAQMYHWAKEQISAATECEESDGPDYH